MVVRNYWDSGYVMERLRRDVDSNDSCHSVIMKGPTFEELREACRHRDVVTFELADTVKGGNLLPTRSYLVRVEKMTLTWCNGLTIEGILYLDQEGSLGYNFQANYHHDNEQSGWAQWADGTRQYLVMKGFSDIKSAAV